MKRHPLSTVLVLMIVVALGPPAATASAHAVQPRASATSPTLKAKATEVTAGKALVLRGKVRRQPRDSKVLLQEKVRRSSSWARKVVLTVRDGGSVRYVDRPTTPGVHRYRILVVSPRSRSYSTPVKVTVWRWINLGTRAFASRRATVQDSGLVRAKVGHDRGHMTWNLRRKCTRLHASFGALASSRGKAVAQLTVNGRATAEAKVEPHEYPTWGIAGRRTLTGAHSVGFRWSKRSSSDAVATMRTRIYCRF